MSISKKEQAVRAARKALQDAQAELDIARRVRQAEPRPGSRILITATFPRSAKQYTYLALRTDGAQRLDGANWYVTGVEGKTTWDAIITGVERADYDVRELFFR